MTPRNFLISNATLLDSVVKVKSAETQFVLEMDEPIFSEENTLWLEAKVFNDKLRLWHVLGIVFFSVLGIIVFLCCCFRFRIPRTKQEIEADYQRRKIVKKFRKKVQKFENSEMIDAEMNLRKALEKIRAEFLKESKNKSSELSSDSDENDESNYDDAKGARKKKATLTIPKKDQLIQTIYTGNCFDNNPEAPLTLEVGGN